MTNTCHYPNRKKLPESWILIIWNWNLGITDFGILRLINTTNVLFPIIWEKIAVLKAEMLKKVVLKIRPLPPIGESKKVLIFYRAMQNLISQTFF